MHEKKVDAGVVNRLITLQYEHSYDVLKSSTIFNPIEIRFAFTKNRHTELILDVDRHLNKLKRSPDSIYFQAIDRWFGDKATSLIPSWLYWMGAVFLFIICFLIFLNAVLNYRVKQKTRQLREEIKERELTEEIMKKERDQFRAISNTSPLAIYLSTGLEQKAEYINQKFTTLFGYTINEVPSVAQWWPLAYPDEKYRNQIETEWQKRVKISIETKTAIEPMEVVVTCKDGSKKNISWGYITIGEKSWAFGHDLTELRRAEGKIKSSLKEKETLLHEVHHRVKNNMQVINSLLKLQSNNIEDKNVKEILKDSQSRVYAMSAVHETLHGSENLSEIDLKSYLSKITTSIYQTYSTDHQKIKLNNNVEEAPISLNQAYPLGLTINELVSNSLKYAFPNDRTGEITVNIEKLENELELTITDNGIGMSKGFDWKNTKSLGLKLVRTLVENQLDGSIDLDNSNGTKFTIKFNIET